MSILGILENPEHVELTVDGARFEVVELTGQERLSSLFKFDITCAIQGHPPQVKPMIGAGAVITLKDGHGRERRIEGMVSNAGVRVFDDDHATLGLTVRPHAFPLSVGRDCRAFQEATIVDIAHQVVNPIRGDKRFEITKTYPSRPYTVQYREDDWTFLTRLLEDEGIYYWFDHSEGSALVLADDSIGAPDAPGGAIIPFAYESGMHASQAEILSQLASTAHTAPTQFTVASFDFNRPLLKVQGKAGGGRFEIYDAPGGGPESPEVCAARAKTRLEAADAAREGVAGTTTSVRLYPGVVFQVVDHPISRLDKRYLVVGARYHIQQRKRNGVNEKTYVCTLYAIAAKVPYRPPAEVPDATQVGAQSGVVVGTPGAEIHPDPLGRVRVQQHWDRLGDRTDLSGKWMRVAQRGSADSLLFPRIGWTVLTFNEEGTIDAPSVFNRIPDAEHLPPYPLPANKTRLVFKTATTPGGGSHNEIRFEDKKGLEEMFINASRDMNIFAQHIKNERIQRDQARAVGVDHTLTVNAQMLTQVGRDQQVKIGADETIKIHEGKNVNVEGNETVGIGGNRNINIGSDFSLATVSNRKLTVGAAMIDVSLGTISSDGGIYTELAGGAVIKASNQTISEDVGKVSLQVIGGVRIEKAKVNRATDVKKQYYETVGGTMVLTSDGTFIDNAQKTLSYRVVGALTGDAPSMHVEAKKKIVLKVGASTITILPESVEIKSPSFNLTDAAKLDYDTLLIQHN